MKRSHAKRIRSWKDWLSRIRIDKYTAWIMVLSISAAVLLSSRFFNRSPRTGPQPPVTESAPEPELPAKAVPAAPAAARDFAEERETAEVVRVVGQLLSEFHVGPHLIRDKGASYVATIPKSLHFIEFYGELRQRLEKVDGEVSGMKDDRGKSRIDFDVLVDDKLTKHFTFFRRSGLKAVSGKAAIIIDDFGYSYNGLAKEFIWFDMPLTLSVIPGLKESKRVARDAVAANKCVLVHMPMGPREEKFSDEGYALLAGQSPGTTRLRIRSAFAELPMAVGMNNHQGSLVTADRAMMKTILSELKSSKKIFIDSRTSSQSVAEEVGRSLRLAVASNQVFLDAENDETFIRDQMNKLADLAVSQGEVVAIGHLRKRTLKILRERMPQLQARGVEFVYLTDLF